VSLDIYIVALFLSLPSRDEAKGAEEVGNPRPIIPRSCAACLAWVRAGDEGEAHYRRDGLVLLPVPQHMLAGGITRLADRACGKRTRSRRVRLPARSRRRTALSPACACSSPRSRGRRSTRLPGRRAGIVKGKADTPATPAPHPGSQDDGARVDAGAAAGECKEGREGADRASGFVRADPNG
jgi:hypothetical protein